MEKKTILYQTSTTFCMNFEELYCKLALVYFAKEEGETEKVSIFYEEALFDFICQRVNAYKNTHWKILFKPFLSVLHSIAFVQSDLDLI